MKCETLSSSSFSTYTWCEWKWFLTYVLKFRDKAGYSAFGGTCAHAVLEAMSEARMAGLHEKDNDKIATKIISNMIKDEDGEPRVPIIWENPSEHIWDPEILFEIFVEYYGEKDQENKNKLLNQRAKYSGILNGIHWILGTPYNPRDCNTIATENRFDIAIEGPRFITGRKDDGQYKYLELLGFIDRIDQIDDDTIEIIDYKTGSLGHWPPGSKQGDKTLEDFYEDIQCLLYYYAARRLYPQFKQVLVTFIYTTKKKTFTVSMGEEDIRRLEEKVRLRFTSIRNNEEPKQNNGFWCKHICSYGDKTGICKKVWNEKNQMGTDFVQLYYGMLNERQSRK